MLEVSNLSVAINAVQILRGVTLAVPEQAMIGLIGRNGAGKTTLMKAVGGGVPLQSGRVEYRGPDISGLPAHARARLGIAHVPEGRKVFPSLTVLENLEMGSYRAEARRHRVEGLETVLGLFPVLRERRQQLAGSLSGGEQQMLAIGRGIMALPDLLLLDEPSQGLGPRIVEGIFEAIATIRRSRPVTILLVEQRVVEALELCDRGYVLETGRVVLSGDRQMLLADPRVQHAYLGA